MELHYEEYGSGKPFIILHGLFGSLENWRTISRGLGDRFKVFAIDQRNHGRSPHTDEMDYRMMAEDLNEFMSQREIGSAIVMGHSMGGKAAMQFSFSYPEKLDGLIVVDILPELYKEESNEWIDALRKVQLQGVSTLKEADAQMLPYIEDISIRQFFLKSLTRNEKGYYEWRINMDDILGNYANICHGVSGAPFKKPCLFIKGERSEHISDCGWNKAKGLFPNAKLVTISEAGHWVHVEKPGEFLKAVFEFAELLQALSLI